MDNLYTFYPTEKQEEIDYIKTHLMDFIVLNDVDEKDISSKLLVGNLDFNDDVYFFIDELSNEILNMNFARAKHCANSLIKTWKQNFDLETEIKNLDLIAHFNPTFCLALFISLEILTKENSPLKADCSQLLMHYVEHGGNVENLKIYALSQITEIMVTKNKENLKDELLFYRQAMQAFSNSPYEMVFEYSKLCKQLSNKLTNIEKLITERFEHDHNKTFCVGQKTLYENKLTATTEALKKEIFKFDLETISKIVLARTKCANLFAEIISQNEDKQDFVKPLMIGHYSKDTKLVNSKLEELKKENKIVTKTLSK